MSHKIRISLCTFVLLFHTRVFGALQDSIIPTNTTVLNSTSSGENLLDSVLLFIKDSIFSLMALIAIAMFLYIGAKLITARGNPEEFKKALMSFLYAVIGIFIVAFSWAAVKLVSGLTF